MKVLATLFALLAGCYGVWIVVHDHPDVKSKVAHVLDIGHFHTLEVRYNANQIMEQHRRELSQR